MPSAGIGQKLTSKLLGQELMDELHIIFTKGPVLVSKKAYASWQEIQAEFDDYKASLGPWDAATTITWLAEGYDLMPSAEEQIASLMSSDQTARILSFATK
jgi:hypothetical protein